MKARDLILALWFATGEDWFKMYKALKERVRVNVDAELEGIDRDAYVTIVDEDYPQACKSFQYPPFVIERELVRKNGQL